MGGRFGQRFFIDLCIFRKKQNLHIRRCNARFLKAVLTLEHFDPTDQRVVVAVGHFAVISEISKLHQAFLEFNHIVAAIAALQRAIIHNVGVCIFLNRQKTGHGIAGFNAIGNLAPFFAAFQYRHIGASGDFIQLSGVSARLLTDFQRAFFRRHDGDNRLYFLTSAVQNRRADRQNQHQQNHHLFLHINHLGKTGEGSPSSCPRP